MISQSETFNFFAGVRKIMEIYIVRLLNGVRVGLGGGTFFALNKFIGGEGESDLRARNRNVNPISQLLVGTCRRCIRMEFFLNTIFKFYVRCSKTH